MTKSLAYILLVCVIAVSCKTDIDISADWENIPVVYSILDPSDTIHYVRITRVFSGNESAYVMAMQPDSLVYKDTLDVKIKVKDEYNNLIKTIVFNRTDIEKDSVNSSGNVVFSTQKHHVYFSKQTLPNESNLIYELNVKLPDGKVVTSTCNPLVGFVQVNPGFGEKYNLKLNQSFGPNFKLPRYSAGVKLNIYFHYYEFTDEINYTRKTMMFPIKMERQKGEEETTMRLRSNEIFDRIKTELNPPESGEKRFVGKVDYEYVIADENYAEQIWKRVGGFNYETPPITNIIGGYGLFACRSHIILRGYKPTDDTKCLFATNPELAYLGFQKAIFYATYGIDSLP